MTSFHSFPFIPYMFSKRSMSECLKTHRHKHLGRERKEGKKGNEGKEEKVQKSTSVQPEGSFRTLIRTLAASLRIDQRHEKRAQFGHSGSGNPCQ